MQVYAVGGAVRDKYLGIPVQDRDWLVVGATVQQMLDQGFQQVGKDFPIFLHPQTHEEYALARTERKQGRGYTGFICDFSPKITLEEDLQRRDLTINAMAEDKNGKLYDFYGGMQDLTSRKLRHISPAFNEDPLRVLRVARFASRFAHLGFTIAPETLELMQLMVQSGELATLSTERIWLEVEKSLATDDPVVFWQVLRQVRALELIAPELIAYSFQAPPPNSGKFFQNSEGKKEQCLHNLTLSLVNFVWLFSELPPETLHQFIHHLKVPKNYTKLLLAYQEFNSKLAAVDLSAEKVLQVFDVLDCWRNPQLFQQVCYLAESAENKAFVARWIKFYNCARAVDVQPIIEAGFKQQDIRQELDRQRQQAIENCLL